MKPSMRMAEWIFKQINLNGAYSRITCDDVYDVLLGNITQPRDFVSEVEYWASEYEADFRSHNG